MITRSGQKSASIASTYSARSLLQACQLRPLRLLDRCGRAALGVLAAHLQVPELGVRHERAVAEERRADARAEREHEHRAAARRGPAPKRISARPGGVGVVADHEPAVERVGEQRVGLRADPRVVDVGGRLDDAAEDHGRESRCRPCSSRGRLGDEPRGRLGDRLGRRGVGRLDADARGRELAASSSRRSAALMPVPPTSIPIISIHCTLRAPAADADAARIDARRVRDWRPAGATRSHRRRTAPCSSE